MAKPDKLLRSVHSQPTSVRWEELEALVLAFGGRLRPNANRTHYVVSFPGSDLVTVARPHGKRAGNHVRLAYIRRVLEQIEAQEAQESND